MNTAIVSIIDMELKSIYYVALSQAIGPIELFADSLSQL